MIIKQFYLNCLAHASYLIGDEETGIAAVIDPQRDIDQYLAFADAHQLRIAHVFLTHLHADFLAGHLELRDRAYAGLTKISKILVVSPPPGPLATALVSFKLPESVNGSAFRTRLQKKYGIVIKTIPKKLFNGNRISPHIFNTEKDVDSAVDAIRTELA